MYLIVVGCGRVGAQLADFLAYEGHDVVVIDKNQDAFRRLGKVFNGVTIEGIGYDSEVLKEAGIEKADALAAVTDLDNTNMMIAEIAQKIFGLDVAVARLYNPEREESYHKLELDYVCGTTLVAEKMLERITRKKLTRVSSREDLEIVEFKAAKQIIGKSISEIEDSDKFKIFAILRDNVGLLPAMDTVVKKGDSLLVTAKRGSLAKVDELAEEGE